MFGHLRSLLSASFVSRGACRPHHRVCYLAYKPGYYEPPAPYRGGGGGLRESKMGVGSPRVRGSWVYTPNRRREHPKKLVRTRCCVPGCGGAGCPNRRVVERYGARGPAGVCAQHGYEARRQENDESISALYGSSGVGCAGWCGHGVRGYCAALGAGGY